MKKQLVIDPDTNTKYGYICGDSFYDISNSLGIELQLPIKDQKVQQWVKRDGGQPTLETIAEIQGDKLLVNGKELKIQDDE